MEITLIRHGKSKLTENDKMTCGNFQQWVEKYDNNGVFEESTYPSETIEKIAAAKVRAKKAAQQITDLAFENGSVALVGHGVFNRLIAKELQRKGWKGKRSTAAKHWNCTSYYYSSK